MALTALRWAATTTNADLATDADLKLLHPRLVSDLWPGEVTYLGALKAAFAEILLVLADRGFTVTLIDNSAANRVWAKRATIALCLQRVFIDFRTDRGDRWDNLATQYQRDYERLIEVADLDYDEDNDGTAETTATSETELVR